MTTNERFSDLWWDDMIYEYNDDKVLFKEVIAKKGARKFTPVTKRDWKDVIFVRSTGKPISRLSIVTGKLSCPTQIRKNRSLSMKRC